MNIENLLKMANQIAGFFESYPDRDAAVVETAGHIRRFWAPTMREQLVRHVEATQGEGVSALVREAVRRL